LALTDSARLSSSSSSSGIGSGFAALDAQQGMHSAFSSAICLACFSPVLSFCLFRCMFLGHKSSFDSPLGKSLRNNASLNALLALSRDPSPSPGLSPRSTLTSPRTSRSLSAHSPRVNGQGFPSTHDGKKIEPIPGSSLSVFSWFSP
jgi:hypothetical protein